jgi:hypothetical protein
VAASRCRSSTEHPVGGGKQGRRKSSMSPITTSLIVCACVFGGALLGMFLRRVLPEHHLNADSRSTVNLGIGLIGTMHRLRPAGRFCGSLSSDPGLQCNATAIRPDNQSISDNPSTTRYLMKRADSV